MSNLSPQFIRGTIALFSLIILIISGSIPHYNYLYRPSFQPQPQAFSIWGLIYLSLFAMSIKLFFENKLSITNKSLYLLSASLLLGSGWGFTVLTYPILSSIFLSLAAIFAIMCIFYLRPNLTSFNGWIMSFGPSLLAGWLSLASGLGFSLAANSIGLNIPDLILLPFGLLAAIVSAYSGAPGVPMALLWAAFYSKNTLVTNIIYIISILSLFIGFKKGIASSK
jgi:hypothetical protein